MAVPVVGKGISLLGLCELFKKGRHLQDLPPQLDEPMAECIGALLTVDSAARVHTLAMLQACRLFARFEWDALLCASEGQPRDCWAVLPSGSATHSGCRGSRHVSAVRCR